VDDEAAISRLPKTHAAALRLRARGFDDEAIAKALVLESDAVAPLLAIADAKLAALTRPRTPGSPDHKAEKET
jgi:prolyl-tRNA editing enzyme YbaK/EbsC (Cys-tRNA(Pro) deacylase)